MIEVLRSWIEAADLALDLQLHAVRIGVGLTFNMRCLDSLLATPLAADLNHVAVGQRIECGAVNNGQLVKQNGLAQNLKSVGHSIQCRDRTFGIVHEPDLAGFSRARCLIYGPVDRHDHSDLEVGENRRLTIHHYGRRVGAEMNAVRVDTAKTRYWADGDDVGCRREIASGWRVV